VYLIRDYCIFQYR
jgi:hypothetical protein